MKTIVHVEYIKRIPSNCIEVRYSKTRGRIKLLSYAVHGDNYCYVSHETTEHLRKVNEVDLARVLTLEQQRNPTFPIHIV
jgi:hypothetical protein